MKVLFILRRCGIKNFLRQYCTMVTEEAGSKNANLSVKDDVKWTPPQASITLQDDLAISRFAKIVEHKYDLKFGSYHDLHRWSVEHYDQFWFEIWHFCQVISSKPFTQVVDTSKNIEDIPGWFSGSMLNYTENILMKHDDSKVAIYAAAEAFPGEIRTVTIRQLKEQVSKYASSLKKCGVQKGDRVAGYMPNCVECVVAMLATASLGAIWSSTSLDFGTTAILDRLSQVEPKVLFSVEATMYNGKQHENLEKLNEIAKELPSLEKVVLIPYLKEKLSNINVAALHKCILLEDFLKLPKSEGYGKLQFQEVPFNHPLFIMFSSGTTGPPKCMVHSVGGTLLKHLEEHVIQANLSHNDITFFYTTVGWMMWNWLVTTLAAGSAIVLYDGSPFYPHNGILFDLVSEIGVTALGLGAKCYSVFETNGLIPMQTNDLSKLKVIFSTGSTLKPQSYDYIYEKVKKNILVASVSGGTDIIACFIGCTWALPVRRGFIQCAMLGCQIESWDETGRQVFDERGELVCTKPFPSMPTHFLNDAQGLKYKNAYFIKYAGVWAHGDFCIIDSKTGGILMLGRSDGTLNPGGVRFGSAEIYHLVESFPDIADSLCVSQKISPDDERVVLFIKMKQGVSFTGQLAQDIRVAVRSQLSARHVPTIILPIEDIPYTTSGKKVEIAVKRAIAGEKLPNLDYLSNPESLQLYYSIPELSLELINVRPQNGNDSV